MDGQIDGTAAHKEQSLSDLLRSVSASAGDKITLGAIAEAMGDRSFGAFLIVFCLPNLIPLPPGATFILGLPLIFVSVQMAFSHRPTIWLPKRLYNYAFDNKGFAAVLDKFLPWMARIERFIKPRGLPHDPRMVERAIGVFALLLSIVIFLPIPLGNMGPAYALALMGLGISERDAFVLAFGAAIGLVFSAIVAFVGYEIFTIVIPAFFRNLPHYWGWLLSYLG